MGNKALGDYDGGGVSEESTCDASWTSSWIHCQSLLEALWVHLYVDDGAGGSHTAAGTFEVKGCVDKSESASALYFEDPSTGTTANSITIVAGTDVNQPMLIERPMPWIQLVFTRTDGDENDQIRTYIARMRNR